MKRLTALIAVLLFAGLWLTYMGPLSHILFYHEQHQLFLFSGDYFRQMLARGELMEWFTAFLVQFFYYRWLGAAVMALLLTAIYLICHRCLSLLFGRDTLQLALVPPLLLMLYTETTSHSLSFLVISFYALLMLWLLLDALRHWMKRETLLPIRFIRKSRTAVIVSLVCAVLMAVGATLRFRHAFSFKERMMLLTEQAAKQGNWTKVQDYTERYLNTGVANQYFSYFHTLAIYHRGKLPYTLFNYPMTLGVKSIYFPWNSDSREVEYGHFLYEDLGLLSEAIRWETEALVVWGETAPHLINLSRYYIATHRADMAKPFISRLAQSLFYRSTARQLLQQAESGRVPGLVDRTKGPDRPGHFVNVSNIGPDMDYLLEKDATNQMAFEYLMAHLLLSNNIVKFVEELPRIRAFGYPQLPPVYEQALLIYRTGVGEEKFRQAGFTISNETEQQFQRYYQLYQMGDMQALQQQFGNTYWFYMNFVSPYGNKVITQFNEEQRRVSAH